jgi:hypothetical protein
MPLPTGTWNINANGTTGTLVIGTTSSGFNGTVLGSPFTGFFDETNQEFSFMRVLSPDVSQVQIYYGTLFSFSPNVSTIVYTLGGTFRQFPPPSTPPTDIPPFEWMAQLSQKTKEKEGKDGKDKEESKDTKDVKDKVDTKEHEKVPKDKELEQPQGAREAASQLSQRLSAVEQALAVGQAFISSSERPTVGAQATGNRKP